MDANSRLSMELFTDWNQGVTQKLQRSDHNFCGDLKEFEGEGRSGAVSEGNAGDLLEVVEEGDVFPGREKGCEGVALAVADLEGEKTAGRKGGEGLRDEAAIDGEAVGAGVKRGAGLEVADFGVEGDGVGGGDVGRVGDDGVEESAARDGSEEIGLEEVDAGVDGVGLGVGLGDGEGFGGEVDGGDGGVGEIGGEGEGDGSGAGAEVEDAEGAGGVFFRAAGLKVLQDGFDEVLGLGAGDENGGRDAEREAEEFLMSGDVLDGLVAEAPGDGFEVEGELGGGEVAFRVGEERGAGKAEGVEEEQFGVACSGGAEALDGGEIFSGAREGLAEIHGHIRL
jgi:hypothetical protein